MHCQSKDMTDFLNSEGKLKPLTLIKVELAHKFFNDKIEAQCYTETQQKH